MDSAKEKKKYQVWKKMFVMSIGQVGTQLQNTWKLEIKNFVCFQMLWTAAGRAAQATYFRPGGGPWVSLSPDEDLWKDFGHTYRKGTTFFIISFKVLSTNKVERY